MDEEVRSSVLGDGTSDEARLQEGQKLGDNVVLQENERQKSPNRKNRYYLTTCPFLMFG
jgi:hypothetical protein